MKLTKLALKTLLRKGYFPKELPPPFVTASFAAAVSRNKNRLPPDFVRSKADWCAYTPYSLARPGSLRRRLAIINPIAFYQLAAVIVRNQKDLFTLASRGGIALSTPNVGGKDGRAIEPRVPLSSISIAKAKGRVAKCYALAADISRFYPSIYTHALDWAIRGKTRAKANARNKRSAVALGSQIDKLVQACQEGQTRGIPMGPDTSLLLSHVLLGAVDRRLEARGFAYGSRFIDDYELVFETRSDAERALAELEEALAEFELELNPAKTRIDELPLPLEEESIAELRRFSIRRDSVGERTDLVHYFTRAFALAKLNPSRPILRYAIGRFVRQTVRKTSGDLLQSLILQAASVEPGVWPTAITALQMVRAVNEKLPIEPLEKVINMVVRQQAPRHHSSEVAWSLWAAIVFKVPLEAKAARKVVAMADDACALLLLHMQEMHLVPSRVSVAPLRKFLTKSELRKRHWLLAYESWKKGWLKPKPGENLDGDPAFAFLKKHGVEFYDRNLPVLPPKIRKKKPRAPKPGLENEPTDSPLDTAVDDYEADALTGAFGYH